MKNFGIGGKFAVVVLVFVVTIFAVFGIGLYNLVHVKNVSSNVIEVVAARRYTSTVVYTVIEAASSLEKDMILNKDKELAKKLVEGFQTNLAHANDFMGKLKPLITPAGQKDYDSAVINFQSWKDATIKVNALAVENKDDEAYALMVSDLNPAKEAFAKDVLSIATAANTEFDQAMIENNETFGEARNFGILVSLIGLVIGCGLSFVIIRNMKNSINKMVDTLNDTSLQVASASAQVATSSQSLAETSTEQASSLEETSSAVEEMNSMIARNAQAARESSELSQRGMASASRGQQVVQSMLASMTEINLANKEVVRQTDESNQRIAEIVQVINEIGNKTKVINEIVFQTKLLSFNASVEAARAGEHGKGFAVVAEEVGNLAQMSGSAAKDITALLDGSVQKVQAIVSDSKAKIEKIIGENNKKVESGTRIAGECRDVLNEIVEGMGTVSQMVQSISGASDEQSRGIDEINRAIIQLDQVTQSNAATSEEAASASEELSAQAGHMKVAVNGLMRIVRGANTSIEDLSANSGPQVRSTRNSPAVGRKAVSQTPPPSSAARAAKATKTQNKNSNVIRMGRPEKSPSVSDNGLRHAVGSDMVPSEDDPRFKDL